MPILQTRQPLMKDNRLLRRLMQSHQCMIASHSKYLKAAITSYCLIVEGTEGRESDCREEYKSVKENSDKTESTSNSGVCLCQSMPQGQSITIVHQSM